MADGPTSSALSVLGARTLPHDAAVLGADVGWPGAYGFVQMAASSSFTLGFRGGIAYGSPFMSTASGLGGQLETNARLHVYGHDNIDVALSLALGGVIGEGVLFGQRGTFKNDLGYGGYVEPGVLASFAVSRTFTLSGGVAGSLGYVTVPDRNDEPSHLLGTFSIKLIAEALLSRSVVLFAQLTGGGGIREEGEFENGAVLRLSLGAAYLM